MAITNLPANPTPPGIPRPGPLVDPTPPDPLTFTPSPSPLQTAGPNAAAVSGAPGMAGPLATNPTQNNQDFQAPQALRVPDQDPAGTPV